MLLTILFIIILVFVAILAMKILHSLLKATLTIILLLLVVSVIFGFFIVKDASDFKTTFQNEPTTYLLVQNGSVVTGFEALAFNFSSFRDLSPEELSSVLNETSGGNKVFLMHPGALDFSLTENANLSLEDILTSDDEHFKAMAFKIALFNSIQKEGPLYLLHHLKDKSMEIFPRTIIVKTITFAPKSAFHSFTEKLGAGKEYIIDKTMTAKNSLEDKFHSTEKNETNSTANADVNGETESNITTTTTTNSTTTGNETAEV